MNQYIFSKVAIFVHFILKLSMGLNLSCFKEKNGHYKNILIVEKPSLEENTEKCK